MPKNDKPIPPTTKNEFFRVLKKVSRKAKYLYRKKWLKKHIDANANVIVCDENTRFPIRAEYHYPIDFEQEVKEKSFEL